MKIGLCGNIELESLAARLDDLMPGNDIVVGCPDAFHEELRNPPAGFLGLAVCVIALDWRRLVPDVYDCGFGDDLDEIHRGFCRKAEEIRDLVGKYRSATTSTLLVFSPISDVCSPAGFIDRTLPFSRFNLFAKCQQAFNEMLTGSSGIYPVDLDALSSLIGKDNSIDRQADYAHNQPFTPMLIDAICSRVKRICTQLTRYPLKCLILDLDNTLWGGVVGEAGLEGIVLGNSGLGKAYRDFQTEIVKLYKQGVLISICSHNNTCDALEVLEQHESMMIRPNMVSSFRINWDGKPKNILDISAELGIGLDSMMFIDDNPAQRELVRNALPEVEILDLPGSPALYADCLARCSRFWPAELTVDDVGKGDFFQKEKDRRRSAEIATSIEEFLRSSNITVKIGAVDEDDLPRVVQLFHKTNQFNLTTKRYSASELESHLKSNTNALFCMEMNDKYGTYGIVSAALVLDGTIDSFVLSCRAFGKQAEKAFVLFILGYLKSQGFTKAQGAYIPSAKNSMTKDFYESVGFERREVSGERVLWEIDLKAELKPIPPWIRICSMPDDCSPAKNGFRA